MFPFDDTSFKEWCRKNGHDPERINKLSTVIGSKVSNYFKSIFNEVESLSPIPITKTEVNMFAGVNKFLDRYALLDCEHVVFNDEYGYAGTLDGIVEDRKTGEIYMTDWKTFGAWNPEKEYKRNEDKVKKAGVQIDMYAEAIGKSDIKRAVVVFIPNGEYDFVERKPDNSWKKWMENNQNKLNDR